MRCEVGVENEGERSSWELKHANIGILESMDMHNNRRGRATMLNVNQKRSTFTSRLKQKKRMYKQRKDKEYTRTSHGKEMNE